MAHDLACVCVVFLAVAKRIVICVEHTRLAGGGVKKCPAEAEDMTKIHPAVTRGKQDWLQKYYFIYLDYHTTVGGVEYRRPTQALTLEHRV